MSPDTAPVQHSEEVSMDMQSDVASTEQLYDFAASLTGASSPVQI